MRSHNEYTLRNQNDFNRVYNRGKSRGSKYVVILYNRNNLDYSRFAFVASKKVGNSVERNRARRLMREAFRSFSHKIVPGYDVIFVARNTIEDCKEEQVQRSMYGIVKASGLFKQS